eukprot:9226177-Lingulodinium_polyedra.AAC.1
MSSSCDVELPGSTTTESTGAAGQHDGMSPANSSGWEGNGRSRRRRQNARWTAAGPGFANVRCHGHIANGFLQGWQRNRHAHRVPECG